MLARSTLKSMMNRHALGRYLGTQMSLRPLRSYSTKLTTDFTPSPPRLPKEEQEEFEKLQQIANSQAAIDEYNSQIEASGVANSDALPPTEPALKTDIGNVKYFKTIPEFEGDVNPMTGERGGPKQDPLKHGNDWSFNGRVTDF